MNIYEVQKKNGRCVADVIKPNQQPAGRNQLQAAWQECKEAENRHYYPHIARTSCRPQ